MSVELNETLQINQIQNRPSGFPIVPHHHYGPNGRFCFSHPDGYQSKTAWRRQQRKVKTGATPLVVVRKTALMEAIPVFRDGQKIVLLGEPILEDLGNLTYRVAVDYYDVFSIDQTEPLKQKKKDTISIADNLSNNLLNSDTSVISLPSPFPPIRCEKHCEQLNREEVLQHSSKSFNNASSVLSLLPASLPPIRCEKHREHHDGDKLLEFPSKATKMYVPEGLVIPTDVEPYADGLRYVIDLIYTKRIYCDHDHRPAKDDSIRLKTAYLRNVYYQAITMKRLAIAHGIIECDGRACDGRSNGYRLNADLRGQTHRLVEISDKTLRRNLIKQARLHAPIHQYLLACLERIEIDVENAMQVVATGDDRDCYMKSVQAISDRSWHFTPDEFCGRCHTNLTNLWKPLRSCLRLDGMPLWNIDIGNSQPTFLAVLLRDNPAPDVKRYRALCEEKHLYDFLADCAGVSRREAKINLLIYFYAANGRCRKNCIIKPFKKHFPTVAKFIHDAKKDGHVEFNRLLQGAETAFIIHTVAPRLRKSGIWCATIHDSVVCRPEDAATVKSIMADGFDRLGVQPYLDAEPL